MASGSSNAGLAQVLGLIALVLILAEGGLTTSWAHARAAAPAALQPGHRRAWRSASRWSRWLPLVLHLGWREALLLGAVLAPTDAAAVFSVLRRVPLPPRLSGHAGGGVRAQRPAGGDRGDPARRRGAHTPSLALIAGEVVDELAAGAAIGGWPGGLGALALRRVALPASGLYPIAVLA